MDKRALQAADWGLFGGLGALFVLSQVGLNRGNLVEPAPVWMLMVNILLLSVPLALLYGSIALLVIAKRQLRAGALDGRLAKWVYWAPRVAGILIILFVSLFALDSFEQGRSLWHMLGAFAMHMLPSLGLATCLALAWRREWLGFWAFLLAAAGFFVLTVSGGRSMYLPGNLLLFVGPLLAIALLFRLNWRLRTHPVG
ncbi:MAG: hypothetical protein ACKOC5_02680 [Chloroflexota bacterium]